MQTRVGYAVVGVFVIILSAALIAAGLWLSADLSGREYHRYTVFSSESVTGLSPSATVRYRGVNVGHVRSISLDPDRPDRVRITVDIADDTPLRADTRARLNSQGLTGVAHLELTGGSPDAPPPEQPDGEPYPVLESTPSLMVQLEAALQEGLGSLERISNQVEKLLDDGNLEQLTATLSHLERMSRGLADSTGQIDRMMERAEGMMEDGSRLSRELSAEIPQALRQFNETLAEVEDTARVIARAGEDIGDATRAGSTSLQDITSTTLPQLAALLRELEGLADGMGTLTEELSENPSILLYGRPPRPLGPGEE